jgi:hypothetical protein
MQVPPLPRQTGGPFFETYTKGLTSADLERLFTRETPEAYRLFSRQIDFEELKKRPWYSRLIAHGRLLFLAFTLKLSPARRAIYGVALVASLVGLVELFREVHFLLIPHPAFAPGTLWLLSGFLLVNLLVLLEVADRLSLKNDLEVARDIQVSKRWWKATSGVQPRSSVGRSSRRSRRTAGTDASSTTLGPAQE